MQARVGQSRLGIGAIVGVALLCALFAQGGVALGQPTVPGGLSAATVAQVSLRVTSAPGARTVSGVLVALDASGQAISDLDPTAIHATVDGQDTQLLLLEGRPSIALVSGLLLDSSATPRVRDAAANALGQGLQGVDVNRDTVAVVSTADTTPWQQAMFTTSPAELQKRLDQVIQTDPDDSMVSLEQVAGVLRALSLQPRDTRVLLLITNHPLASAASAAASLSTLRGMAAQNSIQVSVVALPGAGGQGVAEALAEATPGGRVEYALDATNAIDLSRHVQLLLSPALGARRFELAAPASGGTHVLSLSVPGGPLLATVSFSVAAHAVQVDAFETSTGQLQAGAEVRQPTWVEARPAEAAPIDSVEWSIDGQVTQVTHAPWAVLLDPEQLGDGRHEISARIISRGEAGPFQTSTVSVPPDFLRTVRGVVRSWGLIGLLLVANGIVLFLFFRVPPAARPRAGQATEFPPTLRLNQLGGRYVAPEVLEFPFKGKLRVGYHPPYMDNQVGSREFSRLPYQDIRGEEDVVKDLSRHAACIWRDPKTNDCYIQLGWNGPGETIEPKTQSQVFHFGRPQDATTRPFRLAHHDIVRLATGVEFVFYQVGLRDKATPESKKLGSLQRGEGPLPAVTRLSEERVRQAIAQETMAEEG